MSKVGRTLCKNRQDSEEYKLGRLEAEKKASRRKASATYYACNPQLREQNRLKMRDPIKVKRRQWDPPQATCGVVRLQGKFDDNVSIHFLDWRGATNSFVAHSDFIQWTHPESSVVNTPPESADLVATSEERVILEAEQVQLAMNAVGRLNNGHLTKPTPCEEMQWVTASEDWDGCYLDFKVFTYICLWVLNVHKQTYLAVDSDSE
ncbi:hypothetical protein B0H14DRAFT_3509130 [Mycena olivaceomarginata]|nr:hypothetical protein B0H14DRAFT_3509130 [Mycena olivaceomarginata]